MAVTPRRTSPCWRCSDRCRRVRSAAYLEVHPLSSGWEERITLFQLYPLLVHSVLFGGSYPARAAAVARRFA